MPRGYALLFVLLVQGCRHAPPDTGASSFTVVEAQRTEERSDVSAQLSRVVTAGTGIGQGPEPVEPVGRRIAADLRPSTPNRLGTSALRVTA